MSTTRKVSEMSQIQASVVGAFELFKCGKITFNTLMVHLASYTEVWQENNKSVIDQNKQAPYADLPPDTSSYSSGLHKAEPHMPIGK